MRWRSVTACCRDENRYAGYTVYDDAGKKIGKVEDFVDEDDRSSTSV